MEKIRIICLNEPEGINGVTWWRMYRPMLMLEQTYGDQIELIWNRGHILPIDILRSNIAIAWRPSEPAQLTVLQHLKEQGVKIIVDYDDDLLNIPSGSIAYNGLGQRWSIVKEVLKLADMVWTSTDALRKVYAHKNAVVVPNSLLPADIVKGPNPPTKTIVWRGDFHQVEDLYAAQDWYFRICRKVEKYVWFGFMPTWSHPENAQYKRWTSLTNYFSTLWDIKPNFIWKPMREDMLFNHGKSNISHLEAISCGAVGVTNFHGRPTWEYALRDVTGNESAIAGAWEAGRDDILRNYNLLTWTAERYRLLWSLFGVSMPSVPDGAPRYESV